MSDKFKSINCPYCKLHVHLEIIDRWSNFTASHLGWVFSYCPNCKNVILAKEAGSARCTYYPHPLPTLTDENIPDEIREDVNEAKLCLSVSAFRASATMSRRALQTTCIDKGATKGTQLYEQINELLGMGIITKDTKEWATATRMIGNDAAHPDSPKVELEDAEDILQFTEQLLNIIYVTPAKAKRRMQIRDSKKQKT